MIASPAPAGTTAATSAGAGGRDREVVHIETAYGACLRAEITDRPDLRDVDITVYLTRGHREFPAMFDLVRTHYWSVVSRDYSPRDADDIAASEARTLDALLREARRWASAIDSAIGRATDDAAVAQDDRLADALHHIDCVLHAEAERSEMDVLDAIEAMREWREDA